MGLVVFIGSAPLIAGGFDTDRLQNLRDTGEAYSPFAKALSEAIESSTMKPITRAKLPGGWAYYFETGASAIDINDSRLAFISKADANGNRSAPDSYNSVYGKVGVGFPYGFVFEMGPSYVVGEQKLAAFFANVGFQALDLANVVYTDMVPCLSFSTGGNYNFLGPKQYSFNFSTMIGAYHRIWLAQVAYVLSFSTMFLDEVSPTFTHYMIQHGISSNWPIYEGFFVSTEVHYGPIQAGVNIGYQY